eukprot:scaffold42226_cov45-Attheya_sp.AAC.5
MAFRMIHRGLLMAPAKPTTQPSFPSRTRRTRGSVVVERSQKLPQVPSLKEFLHRTTVLRQYRAFLRAVAVIPDTPWRIQAQTEVRTTFRRNASETDRMALKMTVADGARRLQQVRSMVGYKNPQTESDEDSWLNIKDEEDPRGRVGVQWPWSRND